MNYASLETEAGPVTVASDGTHVCEIRLGGRRKAKGEDPVGQRAVEQLREYFAGKRRTFDLPLRMESRPFTRQVLNRLRRIPYGATLSYGEVAGAVGNPKAARAVGQAVGSNPLPIVVPCHRVLAANAGLGGFGAGLEWKRFLLELEHAAFKDRRWTPASPASRG